MFTRKRRAISYAAVILLSLLISQNRASAQDACPTPFEVMKMVKVPSINIPGTDAIHGYLYHLPDSYNDNPTKTFPLVLYIHGVGEVGSGSSTDLCNTLFQWGWWPSVEVEEGLFPHTVLDQTGKPFQFILVCPQLVYFGDAVSTINSILDYVIPKYRIDINRIYLTGISAGANLIQAYAGSSADNANRIAALAPVSPCDQLNSSQLKIMANANLPFWSLECSEDRTCDGGMTAQNNAHLLNNQSPPPNVPAYSTEFPVPNWPCNPFAHNAWGVSYDTTFIQNVNGRNVNLYSWMVQFSRSNPVLLPVSLKDFSARLTGNKVFIQFSTATETNNQFFTLERSGPDQHYTKLTTIPAAGNADGHSYTYTDDKPLANLSYYRLSQTGTDGNKQYFPIRKVLNPTKYGRSVIITPNPFNSDVSAFVSLNRSQLLYISISDLSGRVIQKLNGTYGEGTSEIELKLSSIPRGIYFLKVQGEDFSSTQKMIKQ